MKSGSLPQIAGICRLDTATRFLQLEDTLVVVVDGLDFRCGQLPIARFGA